MELYWKQNSSEEKNQSNFKMKQSYRTLSHLYSPLIQEEGIYHQECKNEKINDPLGIITKANEGDVMAQLELGKTYYKSVWNENNCNNAFYWILHSAKQGNMEAQFKLGDLYALSHGVIKSLPDAYKWYTKAAIQGYKKALIRIHNLYQDDIKMHCPGQINSGEKEWTSADFKKNNKIRSIDEYRLKQNKAILNGAADYYTKKFKNYQLSNQEDPVVQLHLAFLYQHGYGVKKCTRWAIEYYIKAAEQGDIDAQYNLGNLYQKHTDMIFNYRNALKWYTKSAQGGNIVAQQSLAYFYLKGLATDIDYDIALYWYTKAAEAGDSQSQVLLGKLYRKGDCIKQDLSLAVKWYSLAAQQGNIVAQNCLSQLHQRGILNNIQLGEEISEYFTEESMNKRLCTKLLLDMSKLGVSPKSKQLKKLTRRALIGDGHSMYEIGLKYLSGDSGFTQDEETGISWIRNAANAKIRSAQLMMANLYKKSDSVEQDYFKAVIWYKNLAKQQDANGQCDVGIMYNEGLGVRKDPLEASKWFIWAADQENSDAQYNLAMLRFDGRGLRQNKEEALKLLFESARQRNIQACYRLGTFYSFDENNLEEDRNKELELMKFAANHGSIQAQLRMVYLYKQGDGIEKSTQEYVRYLHMATDAGSAEAQYQLALMYLKGDIIGPDYIEAYNLFKQAKDQGFKCAESIFQNPLPYHHEIENCTNITDMFIAVVRSGVDDLNHHIGSIYEYGVRNGTDQYFSEDYAKAKEWYSKASKKGDSRADYSLGFMYEDGKGVKRDLTIAINYYQKASEKENSDAVYKLACMYRDGKGVALDMLYAFLYYMRASEMGHKRATEELLIFEDCDFYELSEGYNSNSKSKIFSMLKKVTEEGYTGLQYQLGLCYENNNDNSNALKWFSLAADIGVTDAYYRLGAIYEEGRGIEQNYAMAEYMYQKAIEKDHEDACYRLARLYQYGYGVKCDYLKAYYLYKKATDMGHAKAHKALNITLEANISANGDIEENFFDPSSKEYHESLSMCEYVAEHGDIEAQFKVGLAYEHSASERNYMEACIWYSMAAQNSHKKATYRLGVLCENGLGILPNYQIANWLYEEASKLGSDDAFYRLGKSYHCGKGVEVNPIKTIEYYTCAALLGNPSYQCELGKIYEEGELVQKNLLEALKWYTKAYLQGYDNIRPKLCAMYNDKSYETFFFKKLFRNLSIASYGYFRLNKDYDYGDYFYINQKLGISCALGYGTNKDSNKTWMYFTKEYTKAPDPFKIEDVLHLGHGLSSSEKIDILKTFGDYEIGLNHYKAVFQLGVMHYYGYGAGESYEQRIVPLSSNEEANLDIAEKISALYHTSEKTQNFTRAFEWYMCLEKMLGENKDFGGENRICIYALVQMGLGLLYEYGDGVKQDYQMAWQYYKQLMDQGYSMGMHRLALMYYYGKGVSVDYQESSRLFKPFFYANGWRSELPYVYNQVHSDGNNSHNNPVYCIKNSKEIWGVNCYYLGLLHKYGQGVTQDKELSQSYFNLALKYGCERAINEIEDE